MSDPFFPCLLSFFLSNRLSELILDNSNSGGFLILEYSAQALRHAQYPRRAKRIKSEALGSVSFLGELCRNLTAVSAGFCNYSLALSSVAESVVECR